MKTPSLFLILVAVACDGNPTGQETLQALIEAGTGLQPGIIDFNDEPIVINVPATAAVGDTVTITVRTYLLRCMRKGETRVSVSGLGVLVEPFDDVRDIPNVVCFDILGTPTHEANVIFDQAGNARVEVRGRRWPQNKRFSRRHTIAVR